MNKIKLTFRLLNITWAVSGVCATAILVTSTKGHPPGIIFAPIAVVIWIIGHILLWLSRKLAVQGNQLADIKSREENKWPITLVFLALFFGAMSIFGVFAIVLKIVLEHNWQTKLPGMLMVWLPVTICFAGMLLRKTWSKYMAAGGFFLVAIFLLYRITETLIKGQRFTNSDLFTVTMVLIVCVFLGQHILRSPRVKNFYSS